MLSLQHHAASHAGENKIHVLSTFDVFIILYMYIPFILYLLCCVNIMNLPPFQAPSVLSMGKSKKGYNWRARSQLPGNVDLSQARALEGKILENGDNRTTTGGGFEVSFVNILLQVCIGIVLIS